MVILWRGVENEVKNNNRITVTTRNYGYIEIISKILNDNTQIVSSENDVEGEKTMSIKNEVYQ